MVYSIGTRIFTIQIAPVYTVDRFVKCDARIIKRVLKKLYHVFLYSPNSIAQNAAIE